MAKPGPKPDPSKPNSRYNSSSRHRPGGADVCGRGHEWVEGSYTLRSDGKKVCLPCKEERKGPTCKNGHLRAVHENKYGACRECKRGPLGRIARTAAKYHLTAEEFDSMVESQQGRCAICLDELDFNFHYTWAVDHDHRCCDGEYTCGDCIRGILCGDCNTGIGKLGSDPEVLRAAASYLEIYDYHLEGPMTPTEMHPVRVKGGREWLG